MLDDRSYMRSGSFRSQHSATVVLMVVNTAIFVFQALINFYKPSIAIPFHQLFALSVEGLKHGFIWQFLTFQFLHGGIWHLVFNLLAIYFFGRAVEDVLGRKRFLTVYLGTGVVGGVFQITLALLAPTYFDRPVVGASAGAFGLIAAFATMFPEQILTLLLLFIIPISMRARTLVWISLGIAVAGIIIPNLFGNVAEGAHLGGLLAGIAYVKWIVQGNPPFHWPSFRLPRRRERLFLSSSRAKRSFWQQHKVPNEAELESAEFISREVDPILDKISAHGIHSLTERERRILEAARARMAKR
ncbi:MAG: rhomboid family intramembrane serine protease [Verrucomicrobiales bacterium]|nr:rhomboid family intramembrane serine protease [Verrucomicrobiales bacterium]